MRVLLGLVLLAAATAAAHAAERVVAVHIVSRVGDGPATDRPKRARADQTVTMAAVLETEVAGARRWYSDEPMPVLAGRTRRAHPLSEGPGAVFFWLRVEPAIENMSNTGSGSFRFEPIAYVETLVPRPFASSLPVDVTPTATRAYEPGVGTMRFKVVAFAGETMVTSPGAEARRGRGSGGLSDTVHRVTIRRDDTYLGYLTELYGQPYIWASAGTTDRSHQSERLEGSDCADFVVYGARRMGKKIPYTWSGGLHPYTRLLGTGSLADDGIYRDRRGRPVPFPAVGDLVLFPRHVGVLTSDRGTVGVLDQADIMMHTLFASPHEEPIADSGYADNPIEVRRWR